MNEYDLFLKLIDDDMIDFNAILMKYYKKLNLSEKEVIVLSSLERQETRGNRNFNSQRLKTKVGLSQEDFYSALESLTKKDYLDIKVEYNPKSEKDGEVFYLDNLYKSIVNLYLGIRKKELEKKTESFYEEIASLFEDTFKKQITPFDAEIIRRWGDEREFSIEEIRTEIYNSAKLGKYSLKYVDQALVKNRIMKEQSPEYKETNKIIEELKNKWKK